MIGRRRHSIDVVEALAGLRAGRLVLIDVRESREWHDARIPGAAHLPLGELRDGLHALPGDRPIAFVCRTGRRSGMATTTARRAGLDAYTIVGGMQAWQRAGFATEGAQGSKR